MVKFESQGVRGSLFALLGLVGALAGCTAELGRLGAEGGGAGNRVPVDEGTGPGGETPGESDAEECGETEPRPVSKLLRLSNQEYRNIVTDILGVPVDGRHFAAWTPVAEVYGFDTQSETRIDVRSLDEQLRTVEELSQLALGSPLLVANCPEAPSPSAAADPAALTWENCGSSLTNELGSRAFRRPLREPEEVEYEQLFQKAQTEAASAGFPNPFYEGLLTVAQAVLLSPHLTFKPELVPQGFDAEEKSYALASKLALFFLSSVPDDSLWSLAKAGSLDSALVLEAEARRLLEQHPERFTEHFGGQWIGFRELTTSEDPLVESMKSEARSVFLDVLSEGRSPGSLLRPGFSIVDEPLAAHYQIPFDAALPSPQKVVTEERGGLLSQGFFLQRTANGSDFRRAIHRGLWVVTRLLCRQMPRLDAATAEEISASLEAIDRSAPLAEQMEVHRSASPRCLSCHSEIDPVGLALENYDSMGLWREEDSNGHPITSDLMLFGTQVEDPLALSQAISDSSEYRSCVAEKLVTYALNRGPTNAELCVMGELANPSSGEPPTLDELIVQAGLKSFELVGEEL